MTRHPVPIVDVPESRWLSRSDDDSVLYLDGGIVLFGCHLHVEAHEVSRVEESTGNPDTDGTLQINAGESSDFEALHAAFDCDGPSQTVTIRGRTYVIFCLPYSE